MRSDKCASAPLAGVRRQVRRAVAEPDSPRQRGRVPPGRVDAARAGGPARCGVDDQAVTTRIALTLLIFSILACHSFGPVLCTEVPAASTATVTGMSTTSNS